MKNVIKDGRSFTFTATTDVSSGEVVPLGSGGMFGVAAVNIPAGESGELSLENGVLEFASVAGGALTFGTEMYWDAGNSRVTSTATNNTRIGYLYEDKADGVAVAKVNVIHA